MRMQHPADYCLLNFLSNYTSIRLFFNINREKQKMEYTYSKKIGHNKKLLLIEIIYIFEK